MKKLTKKQEAKNILVKNKIEIKGYGNSRIFFEVATVPIEVCFVSGNQLSIKCTCKHCSIHADKETECSFKIALQEYLNITKKETIVIDNKKMKN